MGFLPVSTAEMKDELRSSFSAKSRSRNPLSNRNFLVAMPNGVIMRLLPSPLVK